MALGVFGFVFAWVALTVACLLELIVAKERWYNLIFPLLPTVVVLGLSGAQSIGSAISADMVTASIGMGFLLLALFSLHAAVKRFRARN